MFAEHTKIDPELLIGINFIISFLISLILVPLINQIGIRFKLYDIPDSRKQHKKELVRIGGLAIAGVILISYIIFYFLFRNNESILVFNNLSITLIFFSILFFIIGIIDDVKNLSPYLRLFLQFLFASLAWIKGIRIDQISINIPIIQIYFDNVSISNFISFILTIFWIVSIVNAFNWIDGLDGLAAGFVAISSIGFIALSLINSNYSVAFLSSSLLASSLGFLYFNFHPAKILMGDSGSYFLGFMIACLSLIAPSINNNIIAIKSILLLFLPLGDMLLVILSRLAKSKSPFYPDRSHIHHKLLRLGLSHKRTVLSIYLISSVFLILAIKI